MESQLDFSPKKLKDPTAQNSFLLCSNSKVAFRMTKDKKYQNRRFFAFGKNDFDFAIATHVQGTTIRERESEYPILSW